MSSLSEWIKLHIITEIVLLMYKGNLTDTVKKQFLLFSMEMEFLNFIMCFDRMQNFKEAVTQGTDSNEEFTREFIGKRSLKGGLCDPLVKVNRCGNFVIFKY